MILSRKIIHMTKTLARNSYNQWPLSKISGVSRSTSFFLFSPEVDVSHTDAASYEYVKPNTHYMSEEIQYLLVQSCICGITYHPFYVLVV